MECGGRAERRHRFRNRLHKSIDRGHRIRAKKHPGKPLCVSAPLQFIRPVEQLALTKAAWRFASRRTPKRLATGFDLVA
jgi:hypothetical protein